MIWAVWGALAFCLLVVAGGGLYLVREGLAAWRRLKAFSELMGRAAEVIGARADDAARKVDGAGAGAERIAAATERLSRSLAYARVIAGSTGAARIALLGLRRAVPRK